MYEPVRRAVLSGLAVAVLFATTACGRGRAAAPELRGTWMTTTSSDDLSAGTIATAMASLRQVGLNTVYVEAWKNGYTNFNSPTLATFIGGSSLNPSLRGRILLEESRTAAANAGLVHGAWFEYGLMAEFIGAGGFPSNPLAIKAQNNGWLLQDSAGEFANASNGFAWMNPLVPEVRNLIKGIVVDAVAQFDLQIVQFDDHLSWPVQFGYDAITRNAYKAETGRNLPTNPSDSRFVSWRQGKMQEFVTELVGAVRAVKPDVIVSLSPSPANFSAANFCTKWSDYAAAGLFDEIVPQVYRSTYGSFSSEWNNQIGAAGGAADLGAGLRLLGSGAATPWADLEQKINESRADGALGHSIWYSEGVSNAGTSNPANYNSQLRAYYDVAGTGPAANPHFTTVRWAGADAKGGNGTWSTLAATWKDRSTIWVRDARGIFDGAGGTVTVSGTVSAGGGLEFTAAGYTVAGGTLNLSGFDKQANTVTVAETTSAAITARLIGVAGLRKAGAGTLVLGAANTSLMGGVDVSAGTLRVAHSQAIAGGGVTVAAGATLALADGLTVQSRGLTLAGGRLDLGTARITVSAGGTTPSEIRSALIAGRNGGGWDGPSGILSSAAAAAGGSRGVGYLFDQAGVATVSFAAAGDADLDGDVDVFDLVGVNGAGRYGTGLAAVWAQGDFNYDSVTNIFDLVAVAGADVYNRGGYWPAGGTATAGAVPAAVPEPSGSGLLALSAAIAVAAGRRWRQADADSHSPHQSSAAV
jgi:autotransporter-associated beta strand protein